MHLQLYTYRELLYWHGNVISQFYSDCFIEFIKKQTADITMNIGLSKYSSL